MSIWCLLSMLSVRGQKHRNVGVRGDSISARHSLPLESLSAVSFEAFGSFEVWQNSWLMMVKYRKWMFTPPKSGCIYVYIIGFAPSPFVKPINKFATVSRCWPQIASTSCISISFRAGTLPIRLEDLSILKCSELRQWTQSHNVPHETQPQGSNCGVAEASIRWMSWCPRSQNRQPIWLMT